MKEDNGRLRAKIRKLEAELEEKVRFI